MNTNMNTVNATINTTGALFIVPNPAQVAYATHFKSKVAEVLAANGMVLDEEDMLLDLWVATEETQNLADHGMKIGESYYHIKCGALHLPASLFADKCEGDSITLNIPMYGDDDETIIVHAELKLAQKPYRYGRFGTFEEVLNRVL